MKTVTLLSASSASDKAGAYRLDLTINTANDISPHLFVKERVIMADSAIDDIFVCVASPVQLEEIPHTVPGSGNYFRTNTVSLVSSDPDYLVDVKDQIIADIQLTLLQATQLDVLAVDSTYTITPTEITVAPAP